MAFDGAAHSGSGITNVNVTRWGVNNSTAQTGSTNSWPSDMSLWVPTWSGEVLHAYDEYNLFEPMVDSRTLATGTTMRFPITGTIALKSAWEAGEELGGGGMASTHFEISLDRRPIAAHFELDNVDQMITQFEFRSELARQAGQTLANERDRQIAQLLVKGAHTGSRVQNKLGASGVDAAYGGTAYFFSNDATGSTALDTLADNEEGALAILSAIELELVKYRTNDMDASGLMCVTTPELFNQIRRLGIAELGTSGGAAGKTNQSSPLFGGIAGGITVPGFMDSLRYMGCMIVASNHIPSTDVTTGDANYQVDARGVKAILFSRSGVASIKKQGLKVDTVEDVRRNTHFTVASMYSGGGVLRPECCSVVLTKSSANADVDNVVGVDGGDADDLGYARGVRVGNLT